MKFSYMKFSYMKFSYMKFSYMKFSYMESCVKFPYMKCSNFTHHFIYEIFIYEMLCEISVRVTSFISKEYP